MQKFNACARQVKVILVNQFGWSTASCGSKMQPDMEFLDIRKGTDIEFGQSIYEPFGIAQLEPLSFGGMCVITNVCGCAERTGLGRLRQSDAKGSSLIFGTARAGTGGGIFPSIATGVETMVKWEREFTPNPAMQQRHHRRAGEKGGDHGGGIAPAGEEGGEEDAEHA